MRTRKVALLIETSNAYARRLLQGIRNYVLEQGNWSIYFGEQRRGEAAPEWLANWQGDGLIARIETKSLARAVARLAIPTVDVSAARHLPGVPYVETNDEAIAVMAASHLLERGYQQLAFCGDARFRWSKNREAAFAAEAKRQQRDCFLFQPSRLHNASWEQEQEQLIAWLRGLPKPVGIMAAYDVRGRQVLDACRETGLAVPDAVAVIGVDNDELICDFASPSLTSVYSDAVSTGYEAATVLDALMRKRSLQKKVVLIDPLWVVTRGSTDGLAIHDPDIAQAVRFIREHATEEIQVSDVMERLHLSRRMFESRFKKLIGRSPHEEIERVRMDLAKQLLHETDLSLAAIAHRVGYKHVEYMCVAFKRVTGQTPGHYRQAKQVRN